MQSFLTEKKYFGVPNGVLISIALVVLLYFWYSQKHDTSESYKPHVDDEVRVLADGVITHMEEKNGKRVYHYTFTHKGRTLDGTITPEDGDAKIEDFLVDEKNVIKVGVIEKGGNIAGYLALTRD